MTRIVIIPPGALELPRWHELWEAREVLLRFGQRDVLLRYRQTVVGVAWVVLQPLVSAGIFSIIFGRVAGLPSGGVPYFLFTFVGMLAWGLFNGVVSRAAPSLVQNQALVSKVFFPRILVPLSVVLSVGLDFAVGIILGLILLVLYSVSAGIAIILMPVWAFLIVVLGLGFGLAMSALMVRYRDVQYVVPWLLQVLLYASPIAYSMSAVPEGLRPWFQINPLSWLLEAFRWSVLGQPAPPTWQLVGCVVVPIAVFFGGLVVFQRQERAFADVI